jgi:hypothetical protein
MAISKFIPLVLVVAAVAWWFFFQWLRHRLYRKHIHTGFAPGTQHLAWTASLGALAFAVAGVVMLFLRRSP